MPPPGKGSKVKPKSKKVNKDKKTESSEKSKRASY